MRHKRPPNSWQRVTSRATDRADTLVHFIYYAEYLLCRDDVKPRARPEGPGTALRADAVRLVVAFAGGTEVALMGVGPEQEGGGGLEQRLAQRGERICRGMSR
jgi:hypothetical protein